MSAGQTPQGDEPTPGHALPLLYNLVYCSRAVAEVDDATVQRIIESSRRRNPQAGITGLLVFGGGIFFQWLEGPRDNVQALMTLLKTDARHHTVVLLASGEEVRERLFPDWDMERVDADAIRDVLVDALDSAQDPGNARVLNDMLAQLESGQLSGIGRA